MDWKAVGSKVYLQVMEGENICDIQAQKIFWKSNTKKAPLTCMQTDFIDSTDLEE